MLTHLSQECPSANQADAASSAVRVPATDALIPPSACSSTTSQQDAGFFPQEAGPGPAARLDTVRLSGPVANLAGLDALTRMRKSNQVVDTLTGEIIDHPNWLIDGVQVHGHPGTISFEASLPRRRHGSNLQLLTFPEADAEVRRIFGWLAQYVDWLCEPEDLRVLRLDASLDFHQVTALNFLLPGLASVRVPRERKSPAIFTDPDRGHAITLTRGTRTTNRASLYDKHQEVLHRLRRDGVHQPEGHPEARGAEHVARFEAQCHPKYLRKFEISQWSSVTEMKVMAMREEAFKARCFDRPVAGAPELIQRMDAAGITPARQAGIFYHAVRRAHGLPLQGDRGTLADRDRELRRLGVALGADPLRPAPRVWLDYAAQCQRSASENN